MSARLVLSAVASSLVLSAVAQPAPQGSPTLSKLRATHPHSVVGPIAVSPGAHTAFVAEAGVLAIIDPDDPTSWDDPKTAPISSAGVRAVELALDPEMELVQTRPIPRT